MRNDIFKSIRLFLLPCIILAVLCSSVIAGNFEVSVIPVKSEITKYDTAEFIVKIRNNEAISDHYRLIFRGDIEWDISTFPLDHKYTGITLKPGEESISIIFVKLLESNLPPRKYYVGLTVSSEETGKTEEEMMIFSLTSGGKMAYQPAVSVDVYFPSDIDPRESGQIRVLLKNRNPLDLGHVTISAHSKLISSETTTYIGPLEEKTVLLGYSLDQFEKPIEDKLVVSIIRDSTEISTTEVPYRIIPVKSVSKEIFSKREFLRKINVYMLTNNGNIESEETVKLPLSFIKSIFTRTIPESTKTRMDGQRYIKWTVKLEPRSTASLKITEDYRMLFYIALIAVVVAWAYYTFRSPVVIRKEARVVGRMAEGISDVKVVLNIRNRSSRPAEALRIIDSIPYLIEVDRDFKVGTIPPTKIARHETKGTLLRWNIDSLEPLEERIVTYRIMSGLKIIGSLRLPASVAKFTDKGKSRIIHSNRVTVLPEMR